MAKIIGLWSEFFWLPPNTTSPNPSINYPNANHLYYPIIMAISLLVLRQILERYCFAPFANLLGIKATKTRQPFLNPTLEKAFSKNKKFTTKHIKGLAKQLDIEERQIERWLRLRNGLDRPSTLQKFCESAWRFSYYGFSFTLGITVLSTKPWLWNISECWRDYPQQSVDGAIWWHYMISLAFYWSQCVTQFYDIKRSDFWEHVVHQISSILLLSMSWLTNFVRIGSLVLVVIDCADAFLETAKMAKYANYHRIAEIVFGLFTIIWLITRTGLYPFWILKRYDRICTSIRARLIMTIVSEAHLVVPIFSAMYVMESLLILILALNLYWTYLILKTVYIGLRDGKVQGDIRSGDDASNETQ